MEVILDNIILYETPEWHDADHTVSVDFTNINTESVTKSTTESTDFALGWGEIEFFSYSITTEITKTVTFTKGVTNSVSWDLTKFDPAYEYKPAIVADGVLYKYTCQWKSSPNGAAYYTWTPGEVVCDDSTRKFVLVSRPKT